MLSKAITVRGVLLLVGRQDGVYVVPSGGRLIIRGVFRGTAEVFPDGQLWIFGEQDGQITNSRGLVVVTGMMTRAVKTVDGHTRHIPDRDVQELTIVGGELCAVAPPTAPTARWLGVGQRSAAPPAPKGAQSATRRR